MAIIFGIIVAAVTVASLFAPKWYRSEVLLKAEPSRVTSPLLEQPSSLREQVSLFVSTQREIIMSDYVLASALMRLEYPTKAQNGSEWNKVGKPFYDKKAIDEYISKASEKLRWFRKRVSVVTPGGPDATFTQTFKIRVNWPEIRIPKPTIELDSLKGVEPHNGFDFSYKDLPPKERAAEECFLLAKWLVKAYMTRYSELQVSENTQATKFIELTSLVLVKKQLKLATDVLANYSEALGADLVTVVSITGDQGIDSGIAVTLNQIDLKVNGIDAELSALTALQRAIINELAKKDPEKIAVPDEVIKANPAIELLQNRMIELQLVLNNLTPEFKENYQEVAHRRQELQAGYQDIHDELLKQQQRTAYTIDQLQSSRADLLKNKKSLADKMAKLGKKTVGYKRLKQDVAAAQDNYERENRQLLESMRAASLAETPVLVSTFGDPGRPNPNDPRRPIVWLNILLACVAGLVLSFVYAFMADHFDHTIKGIDDAERYLGAPVLGSVPKLGRKIIRTR
jgi:uncharacterized protein involved in exopolysaccharide biosynthesis